MTLCTFAITCSKDGSIVKWDLQTVKPVYTILNNFKKGPVKQKKQKLKKFAHTPKATPKIDTHLRRITDEDGHFGGILSVAISNNGKYQNSDRGERSEFLKRGRYFATGGEDKNIILWEFSTGKFVAKFIGHRGGVSGVCFVEETNALYSCSLDRTLKVSLFNLHSPSSLTV